MRPPLFDRASIDDRHIATDGGTVYENDDTVFTAYTSDEYHYRIEYPTGWAVETDPPGGMFFSARNGGSESAFVFVDEEAEVGISLAEYVDGFFAELTADEYIHDLERQEERTTTLSSGQSGTIIEFTYTDDAPCEQWCCTYCFAIAEGTGYTIGVDWEAAEEFAASATRIIDSFALVGDTHNESDADDHRDAADSRSPKQRTEDDQ